MTKKELRYIMDILMKIKNPDEHIKKAIAYVHKDIAQYEARKGQLREQYEVQDYPW